MTHLPPLVLCCLLLCHSMNQAAAQSKPAKPDASAFAIRGVLPWHNFLSGPSAWNIDDYRRYLDECSEKKINFIGFHNYTGGGQRYVTYVEPMIRIEYRNILPEAYFDNSLTARWGYEPLAIHDFGFNTSRLFGNSGVAFGSDCSRLGHDGSGQYTCAQELIQEVIRLAHARGMKVAIGFEFGVHPPEFFSQMESGLYWEGTGTLIPNPTHYQAIQILYATIDNIVAAYPEVDGIWLWLNEHSFFGFDAQAALKNEAFRGLYDATSGLFEGPEATVQQRLIGVWSIQYIRLAYEHIRKVAPRTMIILGGWGGSDQLPAILEGLDRGLPGDIVFSCLNPGLGLLPQPSLYASVAHHRRFWGIPWLEGDNQLWHYQPRVTIIREQVKQARTMNLDGVIAIHWRTEETRLNFESFSRFAENPHDSTSVSAIYRSFLEKNCGKSAAASLTEQFVSFDRENWLKDVQSPEYYPYTPAWGRLDALTRQRLKNLSALIDQSALETPDKRYVENLGWLKANIEFALLLDEVSEKLEPAYLLRNEFYTDGFDPKTSAGRFARARRSLEEAPIEQLMNTYAGRVRSRGELGVLSSINQKLFNEYKNLKGFLAVTP